MAVGYLLRINRFDDDGDGFFDDENDGPLAPL